MTHVNFAPWDFNGQGLVPLLEISVARPQSPVAAAVLASTGAERT